MIGAINDEGVTHIILFKYCNGFLDGGGLIEHGSDYRRGGQIRLFRHLECRMLLNLEHSDGETLFVHSVEQNIGRKQQERSVIVVLGSEIPVIAVKHGADGGNAGVAVVRMSPDKDIVGVEIIKIA